MSNLIKATQKLDHGSAMASTGGSFGMSAFDGSGPHLCRPVGAAARGPAGRPSPPLRGLQPRPPGRLGFVLGHRLDADPFDAVCDHLIAEDRDSEEIVGTYRLQTGLRAALQRGYYSAQEFDFAPFEARRGEILEVGRACVARAHHNLAVLQLLWRGIAFYAHAMGARYLLGCGSVHGTDPHVGARLYSDLMRAHLAPPAWQTQPVLSHACPLDDLAPEPQKVPKLLPRISKWALASAAHRHSIVNSRLWTSLTFLDLKSVPLRATRRYSAPMLGSGTELSLGE